MAFYLDRNIKLGPIPLKIAVRRLLKHLPFSATNVAVVIYIDGLQDLTEHEVEVDGKTYQVCFEPTTSMNKIGEVSLKYAVEV